MTTHHERHGNYPSEKSRAHTSKSWVDFLEESKRKQDERQEAIIQRYHEMRAKREGGK